MPTFRRYATEILLIRPKKTTTLAGITRDSAIDLLKSWDVPVEERRISIDEVVAAHESGKLEEVFGSGTAAVISPVGLLSYKGRDFEVGGGKTGPVAQRLFEEMTAIQYGTRPDPFGWIHAHIPAQKNAKSPIVKPVAV